MHLILSNARTAAVVRAVRLDVVNQFKDRFALFTELIRPECLLERRRVLILRQHEVIPIVRFGRFALARGVGR